jgi:hypothetical protein
MTTRPLLLQNCPLVSVVDGFISFLQYLFKTPTITPGDFRWSDDQLVSKIFITGPFVIDRARVEGLPTITVSRSPFQFQNQVNDNFASSDPITEENPKHIDLMRGSISVICESGSGPEATSLATFVALMLQANRHQLSARMKSFVHTYRWTGITNETPVQIRDGVTRWQCSVGFDVALKMGWVVTESGLDKFNKAAIYAGDVQFSSSCQVTAASDQIVDMAANFGTIAGSNPLFLTSELDKKWYFICFAGSNKKYTIDSIINNHTLKLTEVDSNGDTVPFNPATSQFTSYELNWNIIHLYVELPKR